MSIIKKKNQTVYTTTDGEAFLSEEQALQHEKEYQIALWAQKQFTYSGRQGADYIAAVLIECGHEIKKYI